VSSGSRWRAWASRLRSGRRDDDLDRELGDWVEELAARYEAEGVPVVEARRRAVIETGGVEQVKEAVRDVRPAAARSKPACATRVMPGADSGSARRLRAS